MVLLSDAYRHQVTLAGRTLRLRYYTYGVVSVWDDARTLTASGTDLYVSGVVLNIDSTEGSSDQVLLEQGRIQFGDKKIYVAGSIDTTSGVKVFTVAISGLNEVYREITPGIFTPQYQGETGYKKVYGRLIPGGSLF